VGAGVEGRVVGGGAHDDGEESAEGVGLLRIGVALIPIVGDVFLTDKQEPFADKVQDHFHLLFAAGAHLAQNFLHQHAFPITKLKSFLTYIREIYQHILQ
jgi:hypothetical protein